MPDEIDDILARGKQKPKATPSPQDEIDAVLKRAKTPPDTPWYQTAPREFLHGVGRTYEGIAKYLPGNVLPGLPEYARQAREQASRDINTPPTGTVGQVAGTLGEIAGGASLAPSLGLEAGAAKFLPYRKFQAIAKPFTTSKGAQKFASKAIKARDLAAGTTEAGAQGAVAGALQPEEDRTKAAEEGAGGAVAMTIARKVLKGVRSGPINAIAATAATYGLEKVLGHGITSIRDLELHDFMIWHALYHAHLGSGIGAVGSKIGTPGVVGAGTAQTLGTRENPK